VLRRQCFSKVHLETLKKLINALRKAYKFFNCNVNYVIPLVLRGIHQTSNSYFVGSIGNLKLQKKAISQGRVTYFLTTTLPFSQFKCKLYTSNSLQHADIPVAEKNNVTRTACK